MIDWNRIKILVEEISCLLSGIGHHMLYKHSAYVPNWAYIVKHRRKQHTKKKSEIFYFFVPSSFFLFLWGCEMSCFLAIFFLLACPTQKLIWLADDVSDINQKEERERKYEKGYLLRKGERERVPVSLYCRRHHHLLLSPRTINLSRFNKKWKKERMKREKYCGQLNGG